LTRLSRELVMEADPFQSWNVLTTILRGEVLCANGYREEKKNL